MIIEIDNFLISSEILTECFCCDYQLCKGCCCVIGDSGAPVTNQEVEHFKKQFANYKPHLSESGLQTIEKHGFSVVDLDGDLVTPLIEERGECAYSHTTEDGYTFCAIEKGFEEGVKNGELSAKDSIRKPISCWLYPIRAGKLSNGSITLILSKEHLCKEAFEKGKKENIPVYKFLQEPIKFCFGEEFYSQLEIAAKELKENR